MRKLLPTLLIALALPAVAPAAATAAPGAPTVQVQQSRLGLRSRPSFGSRYRARPYRRPTAYRRPNLFRGVLRALGLAYLVHLLFGWGPGGGSPFGLLLVAAFAFWLFTRSRRRRLAYRW